MDTFSRGGSRAAADSWVQTGPNQEVSTSELEQALDDDTLVALTQQTRLSREELLSRLKAVLPTAVDKMTPEGRLPTDLEVAGWAKAEGIGNGHHLDNHHRSACRDRREVSGSGLPPTSGAGFVLTAILGVVGAIVATYLGQAVGWYDAGEGAGFIGAVVGAVIVLVIWGVVAKRREPESRV